MEKLVFLEKNELSEIFGEEEAKTICSHLNEKFSSFLNDESFNLYAGYKDRQIQVVLTLQKNDETFVYPVEAVFIHDEITEETPSYYDVALVMLDYLAFYFEEYLSENREVFLHLDWSVHQAEDLTFFLRGFVRNLKMEKIADQLLSEHGHGAHEIKTISAEN